MENKLVIDIQKLNDYLGREKYLLAFRSDKPTEDADKWIYCASRSKLYLVIDNILDEFNGQF